jgi:hypothetical protein
LVSILSEFGTFKFYHQSKKNYEIKNDERNYVERNFYCCREALHFSQEPKPWPVPDKYAKMANPVKADAASVNAGKAIWAKQCQSCHGKSGKEMVQKRQVLKPIRVTLLKHQQRRNRWCAILQNSEGER